MTILNAIFKREESRPLWIKVVAPVTFLYLIFELAFNSHLLDVMSTTTSVVEITVIEHWGRLLSGFAVALTCWPTLISFCNKHRVSFAKSLMIVLVWTALVMSLIFHYEWKLNESIVSNLSTQERSQAALMSLLQDDVIKGKSKVPGYTAVDGNPSSQKAVYALIPFFGMSMNASDLAEVTDTRDTMLAIRVRDEMTTPEALKKVNDMVDGLDGQWNNYQFALSRYNKETLKAYHEIDYLYDSLVQRIRMQGGRIPVPASYSKTIVQIVRGGGVMVPAGWRGDKATYYHYANKSVKDAAEARWASEMNGIPLNLSHDAFMSNATVISTLFKKAGFPEPMAGHPVTLKHYEGVNDDYLNHFVVPLGLAKTLDARKAYVAEHKAYAEGGTYSKFGTEQARAVVSPVLALIFSTLGAMIHLFKGVIYLVHLVTRISFKNGMLKMVAVFVGVMFLTFAVSPFMGSKVCSQPFVANALSNSSQFLATWTHSPVMGRSLSSFLNSSVRLQTALYPLGHNAPVSKTVFTHDLSPWAE